MKLLKQKTLYFSNEKSDKVYEVDLCDSGQDLFVVNFRYGRRGSNLKEGTKTVFPVDYNEAIKIYDKLIASKEKKGYNESGEKQEQKVNAKTTELNSARDNTIIKYLKDAIQGNYTRNWKVSRIIWRAGELNITLANSEIAHFINSDDEFEQYSAIYVLSKFKEVSVINDVLNVFSNNDFTTIVGRISASFILKFGTTKQKEIVINKAAQELPSEFLATISKPDRFLSALSIYFLKEKDIDASALYKAFIYSHKNIGLRNKIFEFIQNIPLKVNTFKSVRYIYRTCEITQDIEFLALLSKRIATSKDSYSSYGTYVDGNWIYAEDEKVKKNPKIAFSDKTKAYFNKSIYKYVYNLSQNNADDYIDYASKLLVSLDDKLDNAFEDIQYLWDWETRSQEKRVYPKYHDFLALMYVLYGSSKRLKSSKTKWYYIDEGNDIDISREEALLEVWNTKPTEVLYILANAKSDVAVNFALQIIKDNPKFLDNISEEILNKLINHYHLDVLDIVVDVLKRKYADSQPKEAIIISLLKANNENANKISMEWLNKYEANYFKSSSFIENLLLTKNNFVINYLKELFKDKLAYNTSINIAQIEDLFSLSDDYSFEYLVSVNELIGETNFGKLLSETPKLKIESLAKSKAVIHKLFAINLGKHNKIDTFELFKNTFDNYINSDEEVLRKAGIELLSHFSDEFLLKNSNKIGSYCFSEFIEVREAIQPTIKRLIKLDSVFKEKLLNQLLNTISEAETYEGIHENSHQVLVELYDEKLPSIKEEGIFNLVLSKFEFAQKLGMSLYRERIDLHKLSVNKIVSLTNSDILEVRESIHKYFKDNIERINKELEPALRVFNSNWQDVITWSCNYFEKNINDKNWTLDVLLYIADHTKKEVEIFGRKMITKHFTKEKGLPLLLKLQEHPTKEMQFFTTNYLDNFAKDNAEVILKLEDYFKTSLFNINTNRPTKIRVYKFLEQEALKNEEVAKMTVRIIHAILGTKTIRDISNNIDVLLSIKDKYPEIEIPLLIKTT